MNIKIRNTKVDEFPITEYITRESFWNVYKPGACEHLILYKLRKSETYNNNFDLVALNNDEIIGHIILSDAKIINSNFETFPVLCVGPISVLPKFQNKGVGTMLMNESIQITKKTSYKGMILFGNPTYYYRFGFVNAQKYNITTKDMKNFEQFMGLELNKSSLQNISGRFFEDEAFNYNNDELAEFEKKFNKN